MSASLSASQTPTPLPLAAASLVNMSKSKSGYKALVRHSPSKHLATVTPELGKTVPSADSDDQGAQRAQVSRQLANALL